MLARTMWLEHEALIVSCCETRHDRFVCNKLTSIACADGVLLQAIQQ
jgi:hypothetical protein